MENGEKPKDSAYKFVAYPGNHPEGIREALHRRGNMDEVPGTDPDDDKLFSEINIIWRPVGYLRKQLLQLEAACLARRDKTKQPIVSSEIFTMREK